MCIHPTSDSWAKVSVLEGYYSYDGDNQRRNRSVWKMSKGSHLIGCFRCFGYLGFDIFDIFDMWSDLGFKMFEESQVGCTATGVEDTYDHMLIICCIPWMFDDVWLMFGFVVFCPIWLLYKLYMFESMGRFNTMIGIQGFHRPGLLSRSRATGPQDATGFNGIRESWSWILDKQLVHKWSCLMIKTWIEAAFCAIHQGEAATSSGEEMQIDGKYHWYVFGAAVCLNLAGIESTDFVCVLLYNV